jgi:diacylglycerol kinase (ATP)
MSEILAGGGYEFRWFFPIFEPVNIRPQPSSMNQIPEKGQFSVKSRYRSIKYAIAGLLTFFRTQHNSWIHLTATAAVVILGFVFNVTLKEWALLVTAIGMVLVAECLNTAIEFLVDFISPGYEEKAGKVKDLAAAAVLIASIIAAILGLLVFTPYVLALLSR